MSPLSESPDKKQCLDNANKICKMDLDRKRLVDIIKKSETAYTGISSNIVRLKHHNVES